MNKLIIITLVATFLLFSGCGGLNSGDKDDSRIGVKDIKLEFFGPAKGSSGEQIEKICGLKQCPWLSFRKCSNGHRCS